MKRKLTACLLAAVLSVLAVALAALPASADSPTVGDIWSIYNLELNANEMPVYGKAPAHSYTAEGLRVVPTDETEFTVQTEYAYSPDDGFFMEIRIEDAALFEEGNQLVFHLWDQMGMIVGYTHSGSGFYALVSPGEENHYVVGMVTREGKGNQEGETSMSGAIRIPVDVTSDGKYVYTIAASKGVITVNGKTISKNEEVADFLRSEGADGKVYVGFSMMSLNQSPLSAVTITRFGIDEATATVPNAAAPDVPAPDTQPSGPATPVDPENPADTQPDPPVEDDTPADRPGQETDPEDSAAGDSESGTGDHPDNGAESDSSREPGDGTDEGEGNQTDDAPDGPSDGDEDTTDELLKDGMAKDTLNFFNSINMFDNCSATLGMGSVTALTVLLACAAWAFRRKE